MISPDVGIKRSKGGWTLAITEADVDVAREENVEERRSRAISGRWSGLRGFTCQTCHLHTTSYSSITPSLYFPNQSKHSAKTVFPLLSQKHINIVFTQDMEIPGGKGALIPFLFHTFCWKSKSF